MPISADTENKLKRFVSLIGCPLCGRRTDRFETLTSCGHHFCADCVDKHVLNGSQKCPKCFTVNYRHDCRDDLFVNSIAKSAIKLSKGLAKMDVNKRSVSVDNSSPTNRFLLSGSKSEPKKPSPKQTLNTYMEDKWKKAIAAREKKSMKERANKLAANTSKAEPKKLPKFRPKPLVVTEVVPKRTYKSDDSDVESIPDSIDNPMTQISPAKELMDSLFGSPKNPMGKINKNDKKSATDSSDEDVDEENKDKNSKPKTTTDPKKTPMATEAKSVQKNIETAEKVVQTSFKEPTKAVLHSVSIQCESSGTDVAVQTETTADVQPINGHTECQLETCFRNVLNLFQSIPSDSMKTFFEVMMQIKDNQQSERSEEKRGLPKDEPSEEPMKQNKEKDPEEESATQTEEKVIKDQISIINAPEVSKVPKRGQRKKNRVKSLDEVEEVVEPSKAETGKREINTDPKPKRRQQRTAKKTEIVTQTKDNLNEKEKQTEENADKTVVISDSSGQSNSTTAAVRPRTKRGSEENKTDAKKKRVYVSSDEEDEEKMDEDLEEEVKEPKEVEKKSRGGRQSVQTKNTAAKDSAFQSTGRPIIRTRVSGLRRTPNTDKNKTSKDTQMIEESAKKTLNDSTLHSTDIENKNDTEDVPKQRVSRRKNVPKKIICDESDEEEEGTEPIVEKPQKSEEKEEKKAVETIVKSTPKYKPRPKSRQTQKLEDSDWDQIIKSSNTKAKKDNEEAKEEENDIFKRPPPPSPATSEASSTSSRLRSSSSERSSNQKRVVMCSGMDEKQKRKVENVCHELDAEYAPDWTERVTHLVISLADNRPKKDMICPRNAKYLKALVANKWIISFDWVCDSIRSNRWVDETPYEIKADKSATERGLPHISRTSRQKLFDKQMFQFVGNFGELLNDFKEIVTLGGGQVVKSIQEFQKRKPKSGIDKMVIVSATGLPATQPDGVKYVSKGSFMTAISNFTPI